MVEATLAQSLALFSPKQSRSNLIPDRDDRDNFAILLGQFNVCLAISESVDKSRIIDIKDFQAVLL